MKWAAKLYKGAQAAAAGENFLDRVMAGEACSNVYIITEASAAVNQMDIFPLYVTMQPWFRKRDIYIAGIALGREDAFNLTVSMTADALRKYGKADLRSLIRDMKDGDAGA